MTAGVAACAVAGLSWTPCAFAAGLERVPVPGSALALARTVGIDVPVEPARVVADAARALYHSPAENEKARTALASLRAATATLTEFQRLVDRVQAGEGGISLAQSANREQRESLDRLLEFLAFRRREVNGQSVIEARGDRAGAERVQLLTTFGVDLDRFDVRLNAGEQVRLSVPEEIVAVPFTAEFWGRVIFGRSIEPSALVMTMLLDRRAALLMHGLVGLDAGTLEYLTTQPELVKRLYADHAVAFAGFSGRLEVREGRVVTPGGARAVPLWESVVGARVSQPSAFIPALFGRDGGRLAYVYDVIANLDPARQALVFGTWIANERQAERFAALIAASVNTDVTWSLERTPFNRPAYDVAHLLASIRVGPDGAPAAPASRRFWRVVFEGSGVPDDPARELGDPASDATIDAAWLVQQLPSSDSRARRIRIEQLTLGQRTFAGVEANAFPDALVALRALPEFPALVRTLERVGIRDPSVYVAAVRRAQTLSGLAGREAFVSLSQYQGAVALVARLCQVRALTPVEGGALVKGLSALSTTDGRYRGAVAAWMEDSLLAALRVGDNPRESGLVRALAGLTANQPVVRVAWEGRLHEVSVARADTERITRVRERQGGPALDQVLDLNRVVVDLLTPPVSLDDVSQSVALLRAMGPTFAARGADEMPPGVEPTRGGADAIAESVRNLSRITRPENLEGVLGAVQPLVDVIDQGLADVLRSIVYALDIGEADGRLMAGGNVSLRHDFGLAERGPLQMTLRWMEPFHLAPAGERWRISGSLLGLNLAFGRQSLRRLSTGAARAPRIGSNEELTFIRGAALLRADRLDDADLRSLAGAIDAGRARVEQAVGDAEAFDRLATEVQMDHWRRNMVHWQFAARPDAARDYFSMVELVALGGGAPPNGDAWGVASTSGCWCTTLVGSNMVWAYTGRSQAGVLPGAIPDLNLRVASILADLGLPAALAKGVLAFALQDYLEMAAPVDAHDYVALTRAARALTRERVEDYVASLAARGPLRLVGVTTTDR